MGSNPQQYCLKWNNHQSNLLRVFTRLLGEAQFTDVLLAAEGKAIRAHKVVLSACSSYFENLFLAFNEKNQIVILKDTSYADALAIVEFMYKGEINVAQDHLASLLKTAENLKVKGLAEVSSTPAAAAAAAAVTAAPAPEPVGPSVIVSTPKSTNPLLEHHPQKYTNTSNKSVILPGGIHIPPGATLLPTGEIKRKRGRPRILDAMEPVSVPFPGAAVIEASPNIRQPKGGAAGGSGDAGAISSTINDEAEDKFDPLENGVRGNTPTPGGPLTPERIATLGIVKMNEYLLNGTRHQFWEEDYVKIIMQAVKNKEMDMKSSAELLGVSYGTLYGRYRETFGYLKHAWNLQGRPAFKANIDVVGVGGSGVGVGGAMAMDEPQQSIIEQLKVGKINMKKAAEMLGIDPAMLAYQMAGNMGDEEDEERPSKFVRYDGEGDYGVEEEDEDDDDDVDIDEHGLNPSEMLSAVQSEVPTNEDGVDPTNQGRGARGTDQSKLLIKQDSSKS